MALPETVLGIDAGGTGTRGVLLVGGEEKDWFDDGPINVLLHDDALERLLARIHEYDTELVGIGLPGVRNSTTADEIAAELSRASSARVVVSSDAHIALVGAFGEADGIVVIAGTGSMVLGRHTEVDGTRRLVRAGGHGFLLGDEGGGYWIARQAVQAALAARDGTGPETTLADVISGALGRDLDDLVAWMHRHPVEQRHILAGLMPHIAKTNDPVAQDILAEAADELAILTAAVRRRLGAPKLPVAPVGGIFRIPAIHNRFRSATGATKAEASPAVGAARMALATLR